MIGVQSAATLVTEVSDSPLSGGQDRPQMILQQAAWSGAQTPYANQPVKQGFRYPFDEVLPQRWQSPRAKPKGCAHMCFKRPLTLHTAVSLVQTLLQHYTASTVDVRQHERYKDKHNTLCNMWCVPQFQVCMPMGQLRSPSELL